MNVARACMEGCVSGGGGGGGGEGGGIEGMGREWV